MTEPFTNPEIKIEDLPKYEEVSFNPVSKKLRSKSLLQLGIFMLFVLGGGIVYFLLEGIDPFSISAGIAMLLFFGIRCVDIVFKQKFYGFALRDKDILFRQGYIVSKLKIIPFNRIQHSAINRSFFDKIFGISTLKIFTAGGSGSDMSIPGLLPDQAESLNEALSQKVSEK